MLGTIYPMKKFILQDVYFHHCAQRVHRQHPTYIYPPKCWLDISNTNLYIQFTVNPKMLAVYILHNLYN